MQLILQIEDQERVFGPNDIVQGTVSLTTPGNVLITQISVVFTAKSDYTFSPYLISDTEYALEQTLFRQRSTLYSSIKTNPKPPLPTGPHQWAFQFRFPADDTSLPPSFGHVAGTSQTLKVGYSSHRVQSKCYVLYNLTACLSGTDLPRNCPTATDEHNIFFWPNRYTELPDGPLPGEHRHSISVPKFTPSIPFHKEESSFFQRLCKKATQTQKYDILDLVAHIPRYNILGQPLQVNLSISSSDGTHEMPGLILESVNYALHAITRVGRRSRRRHVFSHVAFERRFKNLRTSFPEGDDFLHLHSTAPAVLPIRAGWSPRIREGDEMMGPLCPTFESELSCRTYNLRFFVTVSCEGRTHTRWFGDGEIVLLPPRLDASVKKGPLLELSEASIVEAGGNATLDPELAASGVGDVLRVEADGGNVANEVEGENRHGVELSADDAVNGT